MGLKAATQASQEWHEAVATYADCRQDLELPSPWFPAAKQGRFDIIPIATAGDLYREGQAMHHCVATYADRVAKVLAMFFRSAGAVNGWRRCPWSAMARGY